MAVGTSRAAPRPPLGVRLRLSAAALGGPEALDRLRDLASAGVSVWLAVQLPDSVDHVDAWRLGLRRLVNAHGAALALVEVQTDAVPYALARFAIRVAATEVRSALPGLPIAVSGTPVAEPTAPDLARAAEMAPYVDLGALRADGDIADAVARFQAEPSRRVLLIGRPLPRDPSAAGADCVAAALWTLGTMVHAIAVDGTPDAQKGCVDALARIEPLTHGEVSAVEPAGFALTVSDQGRDVTASTRYRLLFDERASATLLAYGGGPSDGTLDVRLRANVIPGLTVLDLATGARTTVTEVKRDETGMTHVRLPLTGHVMLVNFSEGASDVFRDRSTVTAAQQLSVEEIIARHQERQSVEDRTLDNYTAEVRMSQHFRPTMTDPGYDIVTENRYYVDRSGVEWEELSFSVNGSKWGADRPPFPLLQPEKVLSLPLQLRFDDDYRYRLDGVETVEGISVYVVAFEPVRMDRALHKGTVWIDSRTFAKVRARTVQTGMSAPVVSNEETLRFTTLTAPDGRQVTLLHELDSQQIVMIAGRNILLEKKVDFSNFELNATSFTDARTAARASDRIMYRDTDAGARYYVKDNSVRVISTLQTLKAKALAVGVLLDPSYDFPLPIVGIQYLDFNFGSPDTQLALLFGGVLAAGNIQRARIGGTPLDASIDFFAIAVPSSDRVFVQGDEREEEALLSWPVTTGANLGWQYTPHQKLTAQYQFRFDAFIRDRTTAESFRVPSSTVTNGIGAAWEIKRGGYNTVVNGAWYLRSNWQPWGATGADEPSDRAYAKYTASISRDFYLGPIQKVHLNAAYFGGRDLDRLSRYQFGLFDDTRIHGVPASGIRFDELRVARGSYSFNLFEQYRADVFVDQGWGRDRSRGDEWQPLTGVGLALNLRVTRGSILRVDIGKSFLPAAYRGQGSATAQVMLLKPMRERRAASTKK